MTLERTKWDERQDPMRISISGPPGSGKTTVCRLVAERLDYDYILVGQIFRQMALERKVDLDTFGRLAEEDETIDKELDERMLALARANENIVLEGRLTGAMLKGRKLPVYAVFVTASEDIRAERIARREGQEKDLVLREIRTRERSEKKRYLAYYGIDPYDRSIYDLWIDSSEKSPEEIADLVIEGARKDSHEYARQDQKA
jgi:predicted cytidylate kinase